MVLQAEIQRYRDINRVCVMCVAIEKIEKGERERSQCSIKNQNVNS